MSAAVQRPERQLLFEAARGSFATLTALDAYQKDERHVQVVQFATNLCEHVVAVDFEI